MLRWLTFTVGLTCLGVVQYKTTYNTMLHVTLSQDGRDNDARDGKVKEIIHVRMYTFVTMHDNYNYQRCAIRNVRIQSFYYCDRKNFVLKEKRLTH